MADDEKYECQTMDLEARRRAAHDPGMHARVAARMALTPDQTARVLAAWRVFEGALCRLRDERAALRARLAALQAHLEGVTAGGSCGDGRVAAPNAEGGGLCKGEQQAPGPRQVLGARRASGAPDVMGVQCALEPGIASGLRSGDLEEVVAELTDNLVRTL
ncbi:hypothetical protein MNEG_14844 [Monoraphidium neglectum]|uniref:Uncharacterized protein n=1 Tax=Monoraphidium neglectum TaxID=145388 RepID=A0A0D2MD31_9CHLO|nr:hypothetical protein MNEG_14844 [Monoraphidium neglectum]KIY93120.1 hypothetical protein MNEG_14844 [Monoraphidium neglectum]|eukprot:XP_013892140.1 hypothetical protein MNEG_14844 [Monoraphidium neglectum]